MVIVTFAFCYFILCLLKLCKIRKIFKTVFVKLFLFVTSLAVIIGMIIISSFLYVIQGL